MFRAILTDMMYMNGLTIAEMAKQIGIQTDTVKRRLQRAGIQAKEYAGPTAIYDESALEAIRNVPGRGRPPKAKEK
jgi:DNA-directed RNA polymerase specialized sigma24 family protein